MRAHLSFNLPDDQDDFRLAQMGPELYSIVFKLYQKLRGYLKHGHTFKDADAAIETIRAELNEELQDIDIRFEQHFVTRFRKYTKRIAKRNESNATQRG